MTGSHALRYQLGELVRETVPPWLTPIFLGITRVGNPAFYLVLFVLDYWFGDHRRGAHALGLIIGGMAVITALKTFFDAPRPPPAVNVIAISGHSFPSGHAAGSTIAYGLLAFDLKIGSRSTRFGVAAVLVGLIALSRVVLGVHFVRDVVAGVLLGVVFLAVTISLTEHAPRPGFVLAVVFSAVALLVSGGSHDAVVIFGAAVGALLTWEFLDEIPSVESVREKTALLVGVFPFLAAIGYVSAIGTLSLAVVALLSAVVMAGVLVSPLLVTRVV